VHQFQAWKSFWSWVMLTNLVVCIFFFFGTASIWALAYLHETLRFTSVFYILDSR
jgi:hypothetical protein